MTVLVLALALCPGPGGGGALSGQEAVLRGAESFRADPGGSLLAELGEGTVLSVLSEGDGWTEVQLRGFVWAPSVQSRQTSTIHGLVVSQAGGENLRDAPQGRIAGRLLSGMVLQELARLPDWVEVQRIGWVRSAALEPLAAAQSAGVPVAPAQAPAVAEAPEPPAPQAGAAGGAEPTPLGGAPTAEGTPPSTGQGATPGWIRTGGGGVPILTAPDGDTVGRSGPGSDLRVLAQEGNWARVQLEGWVWLPGVERDADPGSDAASVLEGVRASDLSREYERFRGRLVRLELQYISLERAEQVRPDFYEGEPFLLTRSLDPDRIFVYVAVPPEHLQSVGALTPLETIRVLARVRSGAAAFTGSPVLDLLEFTRVR